MSTEYKISNAAQLLYIGLLDNPCPFCGVEIDVISKMPGVTKDYSALDWFTPKFLFHCHTTHGYDIETLDNFIDSLRQKDEYTN